MFRRLSQLSTLNKLSRGLAVFALVFACSAFLLVPPAQAQLPGVPQPTIELESVPQKQDSFLQVAWKAIQKAGSIAFQRTLSTVLNKIAYDTANYIGSGGHGQQPLFVTQSLGDYLNQIGDEAAGDFIEGFVNNLNAADDTACWEVMDRCRADCVTSNQASGGDSASLSRCTADCDRQATRCASQEPRKAGGVTPSFNICRPSLDAKIKIGLGLVEQNRPSPPNCTASKMIESWSQDISKKWEDLGKVQFLREFVNIFDPRSNDLGIYVIARSDMARQASIKEEVTKSEFVTSGGWLDVRDISGSLQGIPGQARSEAEEARRARQDALGKTTGDILVDAANLFLNQLYISAFNNLLRQLGEKSTQGGGPNLFNNAQSDPRARTGAANLREVTSVILRPQFGVRSDYSILSELASCPNPSNPGPDNCVIDTQFMQAVTEQKTVLEAVQQGFLHGDWQFTTISRGDSYNNSYSSRNISILRKYRIVPVAWEEAAKRAGDPLTPRKATLMDLISCFDPYDNHNQFSLGFPADRAWCEGLIDPNWVLKAPLNYCRKEGVGGQIFSRTVTPAIINQATGLNVPSKLNVNRIDNYCADNETCIKESANGSCQFYGYCNEEKRTWNFGTDSCSAINNTCQAFTNTATGQTAAYLENTLNYGVCSPENAGCRQYALTGSYSTTTRQVLWNPSASGYWNKSFSACDPKDEGCTELLRVKPTWGANLIVDADFSHNSVGSSSQNGTLRGWPLMNSSARVVETALEPGGASGRALRVQTTGSDGGIFSNNAQPLLPTGFEMISGQSYTVSVDVYLATGTRAVLAMGPENSPYVQTLTTRGAWRRLSVTRAADSGYNEPIFTLRAYANSGQATFYLRNLKFEVSGWDTGYSSYGSWRIFEKLIPNYLEQACYVDALSATKDYRLRNDAPAACQAFARKCNKDEVGCELYTSRTDNYQVPASLTSSDYCPGECLGYNVYISKGTYFNSPEPVNLIPKNAQSCNASAVGCNEFTNLDNIGQGGEQREYYTTLKQCIKPDAASCASFYAWEGTENGYQLKAYSLKKDANGQPAVTADDAALCNAAIYNLPVSDPAHNPDCREFYNAAGQVSYHLLTRTITCSENCHPYRMSERNIDRQLTQAMCTGPDKRWGGTADPNCYVCQNGGQWSTVHNACIYQAIPGEGQRCQAAQNSCREFNGASGRNVRQIAAYDFEAGLGGWHSNCRNGISLSTVANNRNGHSLAYNNNAANCALVGQQNQELTNRPLIERILAADNIAAQQEVGRLVREGRAYTIRFLGRAATNVSLDIYFLNPETNAKAQFNVGAPVTIQGGTSWNVYQANLPELNHEVSGRELLVVTGTGNFNIDEIVLSEITDRYYLLKNSVRVPDSCSYDIFDQYRGPDHNLGCSQYSDRAGLQHNVHKFSKLCSESAVGCEQMIDTKNSSLPFASYWYDGVATSTCAAGDPACVIVPRDSSLYAVYDPSKLCTSGNKGCSRLGQGQGGAVPTGWTDVFRKNDPNQYDTTLCSLSAVGCEEWRETGGGSSYFKDPGFAACVYRASQDPGVAGKAWYKVPAKRCDLNGDGRISGTEIGTATCSNDAACGARKCIVDNNDYACAVSYLKTIGTGGTGNQVPVPSAEAGLCDAVESSCTEYIDPVSRFSPNLVFNPSFSIAPGSNSPDGWGATRPTRWNNALVGANQQVIYLERNKMYALDYKFRGTDTSGNVTLNFINQVRTLQANNNFSAGTTQLGASANNKPIIFNSLDNTTALLTGGNANKTIEVRELVVDYQLSSRIDGQSCNGVSNFDNGCILFNERSVAGANGLASLTSGWDAYGSADGQVASACNPSQPGSCTANRLVKVRPDRVCSKWLDCISYVKDKETGEKTCYALGECDRLDDKGECANFTESATGNQRFNPETSRNATGYTILDRYNLGQVREVGSIGGPKYDFERVGSLSCTRNFQTGSACNLDPPGDISSLLVREPAGAPTDYPANDAGYVRVPGTFQVTPMSAAGEEFKSGTYYISYLVNTKGAQGAKARVVVVDRFNQVYLDPATGQPATFLAEAPYGWERRVNKFTVAGGTVRLKIYLMSDSTEEGRGQVYFDDLSIEPVLEVGEDQYLARECRLYPGADSLSCTNYNENVVKDGLEGYCLQHDPLNPGVCLLWYPIDKISSAVGRSNLGYQGKFPLNYCIEVNANFDLVEMRKAYFLDEHTEDTVSCGGGSITRCDKYSTNTVGNWTCPTDYNIWVSYKRVCTTWDNVLYRKFLCIPKEEGLLVNNFKVSAGPGNTPTPPATHNWEGCLGESFYHGLGIYNGLHGYENTNLNPPIRVYDYDYPPISEGQLLSLPGTSSSVTPYIPKCDRFIEVVAGSGLNQAWVVRTSSASPYSYQTPPYFVDSLFRPYSGSAHNLTTYGRMMNEFPFGAASWPQTFSLSGQSTRVALRTASNQGNSILAGRPYGCQGRNCAKIGVCSNDKNIFCLIGGNDGGAVANLSCGSGGVCEAAWGGSDGLGTSDYGYMLNRLFTAAYAGYTYNGTSYQMDSSITLVFPDAQCPGNTRSNPNEYCHVRPEVNNPKIYYGDQRTPISSSFSVNVDQTGLYRLEFNSKIDAEQQPLRRIVIDWGDQRTQVVTSEDDRPRVEDPHVFYHFYREKGQKNIRIQVVDNWERWWGN